MPTSVKMPRLGESVSEGTVGAWLKQEGDLIERDEAIAEIITDKINAELPSPVAGRLVKLLAQVDETVAVGADIALIEENIDVPVSAPSVDGSSGAAPGPDAAPVRNTTQAETPVLETVSAASNENGHNRSRVTSAHATTVTAPQTQSDEERQRISPLARRMAREHDIDLNDVVGTGLNGRVRKEDILAYVEQRGQQRATPAQPAAATTVTGPGTPIAQVASVVREVPSTPSSAPLYIPGDGEEVIEPSRMRLAIAEHMVRSKHTAPHATAIIEIDMTNIAKWLEKNKQDFKNREGYGISFVPFVMKAVCEGIRKFPLINSSWTADNKIIIKKHINLGMAVATDTGLVVPTIYDADQYTLAGLARQISQIAQRARTNKLTVQDMQNSTFVVNNPGVFGTIISMPIINQPHAGILSMDAVVKRPVVIEDDAIAVRSMMFMSLALDHRILDGAGAGGFLQVVRTRLQSYGREIDVY